MLRIILVLLVCSVSAFGAAINSGKWYGFEWSVGAGTPFPWVTTGFATPSVDMPVADPGASPWTITLASSAPLAVVDAFVSGDQFEVFDNLVSLGLTSVPVQGVGGCAGGSGPLHCLVDANYSTGIFILGPGEHSISINVVAGATGFTEGAAYFGIDTVPEPATISLVGVGCLGLLIGLRRKRST